MKRILCLLVCLVMILGVLPAAAGAASSDIDEVSISGLDYPVGGQELDYTYKIPTRGIYYDKDDDYDEVIWYDMGESGNGKGKVVEEGDEAVAGHIYIAELHLIADAGEEFSSRVDVELSEEMELRVMDVDKLLIDDEGLFTIRLTYQADFYYGRKTPVELVLTDEYDGTVKAGEHPWNESEFANLRSFRSHFTVSVSWYLGKQDLARNLMDEDDVFEAGNTYTLKVELDSANIMRHASFGSDMDILIDGEEGDTWVNDSFSAYALFQFTAGEGVEKVSIKGIEEPVIGKSRQRDGFTCSTSGVDVEYNHWDVVAASGTTKEFRGDFEAGYEYLLYLDLIPEKGTSLSSLKKSNIAVNKGEVIDVTYENGVYTVVISFELGDLLLTDIEVTTLPRKMEYEVGEEFQTRGMVVTATYSDGHTEKLTAEDYDFLPTGELDKEDTVITIRYKEGKVTKETDLNITVVDEDMTLTGIVIAERPKKTSYKSGEYFDPKGMVVYAVYTVGKNDTDTAEVTNLEIIPDGELTVDDDYITVRYTEGRKTVSAEVSIRVAQAEKILSELVVTREPKKTTYYEGEYFDPTGMVITARYEDKSSAVITDYSYRPNTPLRLGIDTVTIYYSEDRVVQSVDIPITVEENTRVLSAIEVTALPDKTVYTEGDAFDPAGMIITAVYDDDTKVEVGLKDYTIEPAEALTPDTKYVTVSYTEEKITKKATVTITVKPILVNPFNDVKESDYYYNAVLWAFYHDPQVTTGITDTEFAPAMTCTRGQVVAFLWRAAGKPAPKAKTNPFQDVAENSYYRDAVLWAVEQHITNGTSADSFSPNDTCTLAHVITFLYRAAGEPDKTPDAEKWYSDAMNWAFDKGLFKNLSFSEIQPGAECPRRDIVNFLYLQLG